VFASLTKSSSIDGGPEMILTTLQRGVPSKYYLVTFGFEEIYCDEEGLIDKMSKTFNYEHPAYRSQWNIKRFNREDLTLTDVSVSDIARFVHMATKIYLKAVVDKGLGQEGVKP
jgi:hypothetical protein